MGEAQTGWEAIEVAVAELNPEAARFEPREVYDKCVVAVSRRPNDHWQAHRDGSWVLVYDYDMLVEAAARHILGDDYRDDDGMAWEAGVEWVDFNMVGGWVGQGTPAVVRAKDEDDE